MLNFEVEVAEDRFLPSRMLVFRAGGQMALRAGPAGARVLSLGGAVMDGPRHLFWSFISSHPERISQPRPIGAPVASAPCPVTRRSSSRCQSHSRRQPSCN